MVVPALFCAAVAAAAQPAPDPPAGFAVSPQTFCSGDHAAGLPAVPAASVSACAALCASAAGSASSASSAPSPSGSCWGFEWDCGGKGPNPCIRFSTQAECGSFYRSGCGTDVYVNASFPMPKPVPRPPKPAPPPPPPAQRSYDVRPFETTLLPKWIVQYKLPGSPGNFSLRPHSGVPHPYAPSDVAHVLCFVDQLDNVSSADKRAWAGHIQSYQRPDGFFNNTDALGVAGGSLWHAAGYVTAGMTLLGGSPLRRNTMFDSIASTPALWEPTVQALLDVDKTPAPYNITSGCRDAYSCAQNIASLLSWYIQTNGTAGGLAQYAPFVRWWFEFLHGAADPATGLWCERNQVRKHGTLNCIGGSFHIDFVFQYAARNPSVAEGAAKFAAFPYAAAQMNTSLALQGGRTGAWSATGLSYIDIDGIWQVVRPSLQLGKARWPEVESACNRLMARVTHGLTDEATLLGPVSALSHTLPALVSSVAECQRQFPAMVRTVRPWKSCLDEVPYI